MINEEKAKEIVDYFFAYCEETGWTWKDVCYVSKNARVKAMEWKEEQMTKNAIDFLVGTLSCTDGFIEEFKSAMKGKINYDVHIY